MKGGSPPITGRTVVVTGASSGIGRETARELAHRGAHVVLAVRSRERAEATVAEIRSELPEARLSYHLADLALLGQVRRLARELEAAYPKVDVLVNNAGAYFSRREVTVEGFERTWALNVLSPFLLTHLLVGRLQASAPARVVNVSSMAHRGYPLNFDNLEGTRNYAGLRRYGQSKLALLLWGYELARRLDGTGVTVNAAHPGFVASGFGRNNPGFTGRFIGGLAFLFGHRPRAGARTVIYLASSPEVEGVTGRYFARQRALRSSPESYDLAASARLWKILSEEVGVPPEAFAHPAPARGGGEPSPVGPSTASG